jgi:hypothetical protein
VDLATSRFGILARGARSAHPHEVLRASIPLAGSDSSANETQKLIARLFRVDRGSNVANLDTCENPIANNSNAGRFTLRRRSPNHRERLSNFAGASRSVCAKLVGFFLQERLGRV